MVKNCCGAKCPRSAMNVVQPNLLKSGFKVRKFSMGFLGDFVSGDFLGVCWKP